MTTTAPPRLATRVMKARRASLCPVIEHVIERNRQPVQ